jgi:hypothetical protein
MSDDEDDEDVMSDEDEDGELCDRQRTMMKAIFVSNS